MMPNEGLEALEQRLKELTKKRKSASWTKKTILVDEKEVNETVFIFNASGSLDSVIVSANMMEEIRALRDIQQRRKEVYGN